MNKFSGALMTVTEEHQWVSTSYNMVPWGEAKYDTDGYWNPAYPTRLTIPKGVKKVRLSANTIWESVGTTVKGGYRMMRMQKNGEYTLGLPYTRYTSVSTSPNSVTSSVIEVKEGDYFELEVYYREATPVALRKDPHTWFSIEAVELEEFVYEPSFMLIGHRGATGYDEEHTIASYQLALDKGATYIEMDVQVTKDGKLVCMHDATIDRTTTGKGKIKDMTLAEIQKYTSPKGHRIPSLEEVFIHFDKSAKYYIETKKPFDKTMNKELIRLLKKYNLIGFNTGKFDVIIQSFAKESLVDIHNQFSDIPLVYLSYTITDEEIEDCLSYGAYAIAPKYLALSKERVDTAHNKGLKVHTWTVNTVEAMRAVTEMGIDGMFTNYLDEYRKM